MTRKTTTDLLNEAKELCKEFTIIVSNMGTMDVNDRLKDLLEKACDGLFYSEKALTSGGFNGLAYEELYEATALYSHLENSAYNLEYMMKESGYNGVWTR